VGQASRLNEQAGIPVPPSINFLSQKYLYNPFDLPYYLAIMQFDKPIREADP
jgi:hypothetical protein